MGSAAMTQVDKGKALNAQMAAAGEAAARQDWRAALLHLCRTLVAIGVEAPPGHLYTIEAKMVKRGWQGLVYLPLIDN